MKIRAYYDPSCGAFYISERTIPQNVKDRNCLIPLVSKEDADFHKEFLEGMLERVHRIFLNELKDVGIGDGTKGWIEHFDERKQCVVKDEFSLEGEIRFAFDAIAERIK